ncbi:hypothetical protein F8154_09845 [Alkaliphilus pronyensis]|uniref:Sporulation protein YunB n=1 Tax=Alkaliphilus pronyensis TaxID=1482732 RepID=A0A6I0F853_9FIRM|nr:hypothetical protein [Alkaliphilus pronyensis]KAB3534059.1 hypothetical protein F8154_09845 [Alkaliphilus pronyensis]
MKSIYISFKELTCIRGESNLISIIKFFIFFAIIGIAVEFFRLQSFQSTLQTRIEIIAQDSLELSINDEYRREGISLIDPIKAEEHLYELLTTDFNLDNNLKPKDRSLLQAPLIIEGLTIEEGSYSNSGASFYNVQLPSIEIKGYTHQKIILIPFLDEALRYIEIPFNVYIENTRYN